MYAKRFKVLRTIDRHSGGVGNGSAMKTDKSFLSTFLDLSNGVPNYSLLGNIPINSQSVPSRLLLRLTNDVPGNSFK